MHTLLGMLLLRLQGGRHSCRNGQVAIYCRPRRTLLLWASFGLCVTDDDWSRWSWSVLKVPFLFEPAVKDEAQSMVGSVPKYQGRGRTYPMLMMIAEREREDEKESPKLHCYSCEHDNRSFIARVSSSQHSCYAGSESAVHPRNSQVDQKTSRRSI